MLGGTAAEAGLAVSDQTLFLAAAFLPVLVLLAVLLLARLVQQFWRLALAGVQPLHRRLRACGLATVVSLLLLAGFLLWRGWPMLTSLATMVRPTLLLPRRLDSLLLGLHRRAAGGLDAAAAALHPRRGR
jgi:hypothetical protein